MVKITYVAADGSRQVVDAKPGQSLMEAATKNDVQGIVAECGGSCACGTCRIYVDDAAWREKMSAITELEQSMIAFTGDADPHVRLSCQQKVIEAFDGLVVRMPANQL